jgi:ferritin
MDPTILESNKLFKNLNNTVVDLALQNKDHVNFNFLANYLALFNRGNK